VALFPKLSTEQLTSDAATYATDFFVMQKGRYPAGHTPINERKLRAIFINCGDKEIA